MSAMATLVATLGRWSSRWSVVDTYTCVAWLPAKQDVPPAELEVNKCRARREQPADTDKAQHQSGCLIGFRGGLGGGSADPEGGGGPGRFGSYMGPKLIFLPSHCVPSFLLPCENRRPGPGTPALPVLKPVIQGHHSRCTRRVDNSGDRQDCIGYKRDLLTQFTSQ